MSYGWSSVRLFLMTNTCLIPSFCVGKRGPYVQLNDDFLTRPLSPFPRFRVVSVTTGPLLSVVKLKSSPEPLPEVNHFPQPSLTLRLATDPTALPLNL